MWLISKHKMPWKWVEYRRQQTKYLHSSRRSVSCFQTYPELSIQILYKREGVAVMESCIGLDLTVNFVQSIITWEKKHSAIVLIHHHSDPSPLLLYGNWYLFMGYLILEVQYFSSKCIYLLKKYLENSGGYSKCSRVGSKSNIENSSMLCFWAL